MFQFVARRSGSPVIVLLFAGILACNNPNKKNISPPSVQPLTEAQKDHSLPGNFSTQNTIHFDSSLIAKFILKYPLFSPLENELRTFYSNRHYTYAWLDRNGYIEQTGNLLNHIMNMEQEGLPRNIPYNDSLSALSSLLTSRTIDPEYELMLTAQYFHYAKLVWEGMPEKNSRLLDWNLPRKKINLSALMDSLIRDTTGTLISSGYIYRQYNLLKNFLQRYRNLKAKGSWQPLELSAKSYRKGDSASIIKLIRKRLFDLGDIPQDNGLAVFDQDLDLAVKNYQERHGIKADGVLGPSSIRELNTAIDKYISQIIVNMERCRWVPVSLNSNYIVVNIPAFELFVYQNDSLQFKMKVVVGKEIHNTVIFNGDLKYVVFSPYWNVPPGILKNEVLPAIKRDPSYLSRNHMEWNGNSIRQKPGPWNSLGLVKFLFPNSYNIYLHDSPAKSLFNEDVRAFSHGCIRVAEPAKLAQYLLRNDSKWNPERINAAMKSGKEQYVTLNNPIPVFIAYITAWVDRQGRLNLRDDIYKRDERLAAMISGELSNR